MPSITNTRHRAIPSSCHIGRPNRFSLGLALVQITEEVTVRVDQQNIALS